MDASTSTDLGWSAGRWRLAWVPLVLVGAPIAWHSLPFAFASDSLGVLPNLVLHLAAWLVAIRVLGQGPIGWARERVVVALITGAASALTVPFSDSAEAGWERAAMAWFVSMIVAFALVPRISAAVRGFSDASAASLSVGTIASSFVANLARDGARALLVGGPLVFVPMCFDAVPLGFAFVVLSALLLHLLRGRVSKERWQLIIDLIPLVVVFGWWMWGIMFVLE